MRRVLKDVESKQSSKRALTQGESVVGEGRLLALLEQLVLGDQHGLHEGERERGHDAVKVTQVLVLLLVHLNVENLYRTTKGGLVNSSLSQPLGTQNTKEEPRLSPEPGS